MEGKANIEQNPALPAEPEPYYQDAFCTVYHGDCLEVLAWHLADVIVTDPPYGTGGWRRTETGAGSSPKAKLIREDWDDGAVAWLIPKPTLTFWPPARTSHLLAAANMVGLAKHRALYMQKLDPKPQVANRIAWSVEPIWALGPDGFQLYGGTDWFRTSTPRQGRDRGATGHPYEKPVEVMRWLIDKCPPGVIADPFMGSGTTLRAAKDAGRHVIGVEADERWCEVAATRLAQEVLWAS